MRRRIPLAPAEGWLTVGLVLFLCLTMAWAIDDARWVLGNPYYLDNLVLAATGGMLVGFIGPKVGWGRWLTYLMGSIFAALLVPLMTALATHPGEASIHDLYQATATAVVGAWHDVAILNYVTTPQFLHYIFVLQILVWATSMFASYAVFGHRRPINGIVAVGLVLVANMSISPNDQLVFLILYSVASLLLLIRSHVFDEQSEWLRRRIGDPASISSVYLRGGTVFIAVAVAAAFALTQTASSAPLAGAWGGVSDGLVTLSRSVSRYLPTGGATRSIGLDFADDTSVQQIWTSDSSLALTISRDPTDKTNYYWRARTYDRIDLTGWGTTPTTTITRGRGEALLARQAEDVVPEGRQKLDFTVTPAKFTRSTILSPQTPATVSEPVLLTLVGKGGYFTTMDREQGNGPYAVSALVPVDGNGPGQLNQSALQATDRTYPQEVKDLYLGVAAGALGPNARALEKKILADAPSKTPYDIAQQIVHELQSNAYTYVTDVRDLDCAAIGTVECFATYKKGFCQYYAATMAVILRDLGIPTRIAQGFLPGSREESASTERILVSNAHAWVEVYFPGYGWVTFDPTGGNIARIAPLPSGPPIASGPPKPSGGIAVLPSFLARDGRTEADGPGGAASSTASSAGPLIAVTVLLLLVVSGLAFAVWQRGPRGGTTADGAYGTVTRIASRFGFAPRPTQTVYEYAGALGDVLPGIRPELETVAKAKVESVYARGILGEERLATLRAAQRRLRVGLLRLAFRRRERRNRSR
jgi:transglutaminase-like putative cysteine protease